MNETIKDKAPKPAGLLPKNVQSWVIIGVALLMVLIMWLTSGKKPTANAKPTTTTHSSPPVEVNEAKIAELQNRIQELQRQQLAAQSALAQQTRLLTSLPPEQSQQQSGNAPNNGASPTAEDAIKSERQKRQYASLFASNVALSYRKDSLKKSLAGDSTVPEPSNVNSAENPDVPSLSQLLRQMQPPAAVPQSVVAQDTNTSSPAKPLTASLPEHPEGKEVAPAAAASGAMNAAAGKTYVLFEGTILETVLINRLDGQFSGPVECLLASAVYSHDRQHLLIPAGTKILGEARKVEAFGQTRLAVIFHRLVMPDGYSVSLDKFHGLDQIGDSGLRDQVNNHYLRIFGVSLAIGAIGAVAESGTSGALTASGSDLMRQGFAQGTAQSSAQILDRFLNVMPTVTIREGHRVKVYLSGDLALPDYASHTMPSNL